MTLLGAAESRDQRSANHSRAGGGATGAAFAQTGQQTGLTGEKQTKASTIQYECQRGVGSVDIWIDSPSVHRRRARGGNLHHT